MDELSIKGIIFGVLTDFIGSVVLVLIVLIFLVNSENTINEISQNFTLTLLGLILGSLFTVFGGYVAVRIAKKGAYLNSGIVGFISFLAGIFLVLGESLQWFDIVGFIIVIPAAMFGGYLAKVKLNKNNA